MSAKRKSRKSNRKKVGKLVHTMTLSGFLSKFCITAAMFSRIPQPLLARFIFGDSLRARRLTLFFAAHSSLGLFSPAI